MKIDSFTAPGQVSQSRDHAKVAGATVTSKQAGPAVVTHLNEAAHDTTGDVDAARVEEVRQAIADGRLTFDADRVADKLIDSVRDLLGQKTL